MYNYKQGYFRLIAPSKFIARSKFRQTIPKLVVFLCKIIKWGGGGGSPILKFERGKSTCKRIVFTETTITQANDTLGIYNYIILI